MAGGSPDRGSHLPDNSRRLGQAGFNLIPRIIIYPFLLTVRHLAGGARPPPMDWISPAKRSFRWRGSPGSAEMARQASGGTRAVALRLHPHDRARGAAVTGRAAHTGAAAATGAGAAGGAAALSRRGEFRRLPGASPAGPGKSPQVRRSRGPRGRSLPASATWPPPAAGEGRGEERPWIPRGPPAPLSAPSLRCRARGPRGALALRDGLRPERRGGCSPRGPSAPAEGWQSPRIAPAARGARRCTGGRRGGCPGRGEELDAPDRSNPHV